MSDKLSLGMAVYDDFNGAYFTINAALLYHADVIGEIIIVDNHPDSVHGKMLQNICSALGKNNVKYYPFKEVNGTAAPRNKVFELASNDVVVCCDSHVLFPRGSFESVLTYLTVSQSDDLIQGPMIYDDHENLSTHFDLTKWGAEMWGQWAYDEKEKTGEPFEIPAQGLGVFASRKSSWLGFNPNFRGFGGEEGYIHEKYRLAGRKVICLPQFKWYHRFGRPDGIAYPITRFDKVRNYCIGFNELGLDLKPVYDHFVKGIGNEGKGTISEEQWKYLSKGEYPPEGTPGCTSCGGGQPNLMAVTIDEMFEVVKKTPRDLDQHADKIREFANQAKEVTAFVKRREWNVLLAAGRPKKLIVYQAERDSLIQTMHRLVDSEQKANLPHKIETYTTHEAGAGADSLTADIEPTDLLVIDTIHHAERLYPELVKHAGNVRKRIMIRGTGAFGENAEGGGPGLLPAIRRFIHENSEWSVIYHTKEQYGITVISRDPADKKPLPSLWKQGVNALKASWRSGTNVIGNFGPWKDTEKQESRLALCMVCPSHNNGKCAECGCPVDNKTSFPTEICPLGHWMKEDE